MVLTVVLLLFLQSISQIASDSSPSSFSFNSGFNSSNLYLDGFAQIQPNGILTLNHPLHEGLYGLAHAFYPTPFLFHNSSLNSSSLSSFSTHFIFQINPDPGPRLCLGGMAFVISPTPQLPLSGTADLLGLFNDSTLGDPSNRIFAVELDTGQDSRFNDIDANHVGIDINTPRSTTAAARGYLGLRSGRAMHLWIDYKRDAYFTVVVYLAPLGVEKPDESESLLAKQLDLSNILNGNMYVGFSAASCGDSTNILGWSFAINGVAHELSISRIPRLPREPSRFWLYFGPGLAGVLAIIPLILVTIFYVGRKIIYSEVRLKVGN